MVEKDNIVIHYKDAILNLFTFMKKFPESKTIEEWDAKSFNDQVEEFRYLWKYHENWWLKFRVLSDITKYVFYLNPLIALLIFSFTWNYLIFTPIIAGVMWVIGRRLEIHARDEMTEARSFWFFMNDMLEKNLNNV